MDIALWIASGLLAAMYVYAGITKATQPKDKLDKSFPWAQDFSPGTVKLIGVAELLGGIGLILPWLTGIAPVLTPLAAAGLAVIQILAIVVHVRRNEQKVIPLNVVLLLLALFVAIFRFAAL